MGNILRSLDDQIALFQQYGAFQRCFAMAQGNTTTAATANSGGMTMQKFPSEIVLPSFGTDVTGAYPSRVNMVTEDANNTLIAAFATYLGEINMNTGTFTDGNAMPSRLVKGSSIRTGAQLVGGVVTTAVTATRPTGTVTYTDQDGNTGNSAAWTLPTSPAVNSTFLLNPHLASGDTGVTDITNITKSAGSAGVIKFYGLHVISAQPNALGASIPVNYRPGSVGLIPWIGLGGDLIHFYRTGLTGSGNIVASVTLLPDN